MKREVTIPWKAVDAFDQPHDTEPVVLSVALFRPVADGTPDLCDDCIARILDELASRLRTDRAVPADHTPGGHHAP